MLNETVTFYLNTPLLRFDGKKGGEEIQVIKGKVLDETKGGLILAVKSASNSRGEVTCPFKKVFLPLHKVDYGVPE